MDVKAEKFLRKIACKLLERASYIDNEYASSVMERTVSTLPETKTALREYLRANYDAQLMKFFKYCNVPSSKKKVDAITSVVMNDSTNILEVLQNANDGINTWEAFLSQATKYNMLLLSYPQHLINIGHAIYGLFEQQFEKVETTESGKLSKVKEYLYNAMILIYNKREVDDKDKAYFEVMCALYSLLLDISVRCEIKDTKLEGSILLDNGYLFLGKDLEKFTECLSQINLPEATDSYSILKPVISEVLDHHPTAEMSVPSYLQLLLTAKQFKLILERSSYKTKNEVQVYDKMKKLKPPANFLDWVQQREGTIAEKFNFPSIESTSKTILESEFTSVQDLLAAGVDLSKVTDDKVLDASEDQSQSEQLFVIDKRPINVQQDIFRAADSFQPDEIDDEADDLLEATNYLDLDPEVEDVENLDDQVSIHSVSSSTHLENTETGSASSVVLVESSNSDSSSIGEGESDISHTESSTNGESNTAESVVESLVSMVTTDSSSPADSVETEVEESSNAEDSKDCVESMISSVSDSVKVEEEFSENVTASTRKRRRQVKTEVEPKRVYATRSRRSLMPR